MSMPFTCSDKVMALRQQLDEFMQQFVFPAEAGYFEEVRCNRLAGNPWAATRVMEELKARSRAAGLWNLFLPASDRGAGPYEFRIRAAL